MTDVLCEDAEVLVELGCLQLVSIRPSALKATRLVPPFLDNVVVEKCRNLQGFAFRAARFHRRYFVSQGCPHTAEVLFEVSIGAASRGATTSRSRIESP